VAIETLNTNPFMTHRTVHLVLHKDVLQKCREKLLPLDISMQATLVEFCRAYSDNEVQAEKIVNDLAFATAKENLEKAKQEAINAENVKPRRTDKKWPYFYQHTISDEEKARRQEKKDAHTLTHFVVPKEILQRCRVKLLLSDLPLQAILSEFCRLYIVNNSVACGIVDKLSKRLAKHDVEHLKKKALRKDQLERARLDNMSTIDDDVLYRMIDEKEEDEVH
jgi:hypothetical protein